MIKPTEIRYIKKTHTLSLTFEDGLSANLTAEYLRCFSPSAEVKGHGPGQEVLQKGKENVGVDDIEPIGNYAVKLTFDDGHNTGLYSWEYLYDLSKNYEQYWHSYLEKLSNDPISESKKLMQYCDLPWSEKCLEFHKRKDLISRTTSNLQVRKAIYKHSSIKRNPYKIFLQKYEKKYDWFK